MLRLWPRPLLRANLFPEGGWIGGTEVNVDAIPPAKQLAALLTARHGARVTVTLSDSWARLLEVPWSDQLRKRDERIAYARAMFERAGLPLPSASAVSVLYRNPGLPGLAYALEHDLLDALGEAAAVTSCTVINVMPISAIAYWRAQRAVRQQLLVETGRLTLLQPQGQRLLEIEPAVGDMPAALGRLLARSTLDASAPLHLWTATASCEAVLEALTAGGIELPLRPQQRDLWSGLQ